ncbi:uncharacterized protein C2orf80-like [Latimeria chalumnae]|uniref:uncharacterized protein C2orf80-like n=1 Tax=Latimeria chalumnae TaxID=7897 RepID=UPI00313C71D3
MSMRMEKKLLRKEIEKLLGDYIGIRLRENEFDPQGKRQQSFLDDMAHYNLAINIALLWLNEDVDKEPHETRRIMPPGPRKGSYPNKMEREAMILSSFAEILMNSIPVEDVLALYEHRPSLTRLHDPAKDHLLRPFKLSHHPFAMLTAPRAAEHSRKQMKSIKSKLQAASKRNPESTSIRISQRNSTAPSIDRATQSTSTEVPTSRNKHRR